METVEISAEHNYPVVIGAGVFDQLPSVLDRADYTRALILHPKSVDAVAKQVGAILEGIGLKVVYFEHPDGEAGKTLDVLARAWQAAGDNHIDRRDLIVGVGGGATTDLAGFTAATWLRGVSVLHVPTTLLGMVDAAVGGKTGINTVHGKNLAGAFYSPIAVVADTDTLATLPDAEFTAGMGEVIKYGFIHDRSIIDLVAQSGAITKRKSHVDTLVAKSVGVKAEVVSSDLRESGVREILNYGHTLGHAIEKLENYEVRHGEAVSIGIVFAAHVAEVLGIGTRAWREEQTNVLAKQGLPTSWRFDDFDTLISTMGSDKKVRAGHMRMVLTSDCGQATVRAVERDELFEAAKLMGVVGD